MTKYATTKIIFIILFWFGVGSQAEKDPLLF